ncbi:MAG: DUF2249 domain-containing protein [Deltaproteobacteria bacterium]|nr:DUF2249 domain-containing protein [Deltaproteobacteria bacterium]MCL5276686.1 DUF2249 domain-containing protein [Deltaproteobacteria bacterium]
MSKQVFELDLRQLPPALRHVKIFELWDQMKSGQSILLINDHDPKPLYYQFAAEFSNGFVWQYQEEGPENWVVTISKK